MGRTIILSSGVRPHANPPRVPPLGGFTNEHFTFIIYQNIWLNLLKIYEFHTSSREVDEKKINEY